MIFKFSVNDSLTTASYYEITIDTLSDDFTWNGENLNIVHCTTTALFPSPAQLSNARTGGESGN